MRSYCQSGLSSASHVRLFSSLSLSLSLDLLYYLCPAPSATRSSQVSPVEPDDKLRLLIRVTTRNSSNAHKHIHIYAHANIHTNRQPICPSLFPPSHTHTCSQTHTLAVTHSEEGNVSRVPCWVRECVVVSNRGQSRSKEEAECDLKTLSWSFSFF